jgi:hypothetical protein
VPGRDVDAGFVASTPDRQREIYGLFGGMNTRPGQLCDRYTDQELDTIADS